MERRARERGAGLQRFANVATKKSSVEETARLQPIETRAKLAPDSRILPATLEADLACRSRAGFSAFIRPLRGRFRC